MLARNLLSIRSKQARTASNSPGALLVSSPLCACRFGQQPKVHTRDTAVQSFDSIDDLRFPSPSSRRSPPLSEATSSSVILRPALLGLSQEGLYFFGMRALALDVGQ